MSFFRRKRNPVAAAERALTASVMWTGIKVRGGTVRQLGGDKVRGPVAGAVASVTTEGEIRSRITATRLVTMGVFAFAAKKKTDARETFILIEHPDYVLCQSVPGARTADAQQWAARFNALVRVPAAP